MEYIHKREKHNKLYTFGNIFFIFCSYIFNNLNQNLVMLDYIMSITYAEHINQILRHGISGYFELI